MNFIMTAPNVYSYGVLYDRIANVFKEFSSLSFFITLELTAFKKI